MQTEATRIVGKKPATTGEEFEFQRMETFNENNNQQ